MSSPKDASKIEDESPRSVRAPRPGSSDGLVRLVAHAVNNPLAALSMDLDLAVELLDPSSDAASLPRRVEDARKALADARRGIDRVRAVIAELRATQNASDAIRVLSSDPPPAPVSAPMPVASTASSVLVVDDDALVAAAVKRTLRTHQVTVQLSAREALALFQAGERFDVVICDLMMPEITGMDLHAAVLALDPAQASRMVFVTGGAVTTRARDFVATVGNPVLDKPFDVRKLREVIARFAG